MENNIQQNLYPFDELTISCISDYQHVSDRELQTNSDGTISFDKPKTKTKIPVSSIDELTKICSNYIDDALTTIRKHDSYSVISNDIFEEDYWVSPSTQRSLYEDIKNQLKTISMDWQLLDIEKKLLTEQLVFDILFDIYINNSSLMNCNEYTMYVGERYKNYFEEQKEIYTKITIRDRLNVGIPEHLEKHLQKITDKKIQEQLMYLGVNKNKYADFHNPKLSENPFTKKPIPYWNQYFFNKVVTLTKKQYQRNLNRNGGRPSYQEICKYFEEYRTFVREMLPSEYSKPKDYFTKTMDFYHLETYKMVHTMLKIADICVQYRYGYNDDDPNIAWENFIVPFNPYVSSYLIKNDTLIRTIKRKPYRPLLMLVDELLSNWNDLKNYAPYICESMRSYHLIRAIAYERLKYDVSFVLKDNEKYYEEVNNFICCSYDLERYHCNHEPLKKITSEFNTEKNTKNNTKNSSKDFIKYADLINNFIDLNHKLFPPTKK